MASQRPATDAARTPEADEDLDREQEQPRSTPADQSPIGVGVEPVRRPRKNKAPAAKPATRTVREYEEAVSPQHAEPEHGGEYEFVDESPLSAMAEASIAECHVVRVGPGTGPGWGPGMAFDYGDGRGPVAISKGPVGKFQMTSDLYEKVVAEAGGARYRFVSQGRPPVEETLPGPPQALPMERQTGQGYPNGAAPGPGGGFHRRGVDQTWGGDEEFGQEPEDPIHSADYDPELGVAPEDLAQSTLNGWHQNGTTRRWVFYRAGVAARPPRRGPLARPPVDAGGFGQGYAYGEPGMWDHSQDQAPKGDPEIKELLKALVLKSNTPAVDPMAGLVGMMKAQLDADKARWEKENQASERRATAEKEAADRKAASEESERRARWEADKEERKHQFDLMIARLGQEKETAQANKGNDVRIAEINAAAEKAKADAAIASVERMASIQSQANQQVITAITGASNKGDSVAVFSRGMEVAAGLMGNKGTVGELSQAARDLVPTIVDGVVAIKTLNAGTPGAPNPPSNGAAPAPVDDDQMVGKFVTLLVASFAKRVDPSIMPTVIAGSAIVSGFDMNKLDPILKVGSPVIVGAYLQASADKAVDEGNRKKFLDAKAAITSPEGVQWYQAVRAAFINKQGGQVAAAPPPQQIAGPAAAPAAK